MNHKLYIMSEWAQSSVPQKTRCVRESRSPCNSQNCARPSRSDVALGRLEAHELPNSYSTKQVKVHFRKNRSQETVKVALDQAKKKGVLGRVEACELSKLNLTKQRHNYFEKRMGRQVVEAALERAKGQ